MGLYHEGHHVAQGKLIKYTAWVRSRGSLARWGDHRGHPGLCGVVPKGLRSFMMRETTPCPINTAIKA
jgi:hypothetical protein